MTPSCPPRRSSELEDSGVIAGYAALLDPVALGQQVDAFVRVSIERQSTDTALAFQDAVQKLPQVRACYVMTGDLDYLLNVAVAALRAFAEFSMMLLIGVPGVRDGRHSLVLETGSNAEGAGLTAARPGVIRGQRNTMLGN